MIKIKDFEGRRVYVRLIGAGRTGNFCVGKFVGLDEESRFLILDLEKEKRTKHKIEMISLNAIERIIPLGDSEDPQTLLA